MNHRRWLPITEYALLLGSGAGAITSIVTQNAIAASLPVTALVALGLLNKRRVEQGFQTNDERLDMLEDRVTHEVTNLSNQISTLPTPETLIQGQLAAMEHTDSAIIRFSHVLEQTKADMRLRLEEIESPDLSHLYQDTAQLQDQYTYVCTAISNLSKQIEHLSRLPRMEATEADVTHLKTELMQMRVNVETLKSESKTAQATLHDAVRHLDRRLRRIPHNADPSMLKGEVRELVKAVGDLVPRREFAACTEKLQLVYETQENLRQTVDRLRIEAASTEPGEGKGAKMATLETDLAVLTDAVEQMEVRLADIAVPFDITAEIRATTATYLSSLQWQLASLEQNTQDLIQKQQTLPSLSAQDTPNGRVHLTAQNSTPAGDPPLQWLMAFRGDDAEPHWSNVDQALLQVLDEVSERAVLVWPWSSAVSLDSRLIERFTEILERGCRLEIGWCHPGDRHGGILLKTIAQQWGITTAERKLLKSTLNQLLPLKKKYPKRFSFKILGTNEQFLVCDRQYAIVGLQALQAASSTFPELDLRVKTSEASVIKRLLHRFDHPDMLAEDTAAYFNRAVTRYDLKDMAGAIADFSEVMNMSPDDAVAANNRGVIWAEKKQCQRAVEDFDQAIGLDPYLFAARCNRGWLRLHQTHPETAVDDFNQAIKAEPNHAIPYFYRGTARQKLGDSLGAIADYTKTIQINSQVAFPYCYRGAAYQRQGNIPGAITDLEMAASLLHAKEDHRALAQVTQILSSLKQSEFTQQPLRLHSA
ncbi:MAG: tetratricopeptide repeat protein [Cyanobacteria bacterium P01_H01_bin.58]